MDIEKIANVLNEGNLAIIPTDTVYGIVADACNIDAINKVFIAKNRNYQKPLIVLVSNIEMLKKYVLEISDKELEIIKQFWPGELTILFKKNNLINNLITSNSPLVGIRMPNNKDLLNLINKLNRPIIATSANISSKEVITNISLIKDDLLKHISYIYDAGDMTDIASTIIKVENNKIIILREGTLANKIKKEFETNS